MCGQVWTTACPIMHLNLNHLCYGFDTVSHSEPYTFAAMPRRVQKESEEAVSISVFSVANFTSACFVRCPSLIARVVFVVGERSRRNVRGDVRWPVHPCTRWETARRSAAFDVPATDADSNKAFSIQAAFTQHAGGVDASLAHLVAELAVGGCIDPPSS